MMFSNFDFAERPLVVVDMQPRFVGYWQNYIVDNVCALIRRAIYQRVPILLLEFGPVKCLMDRTHPQIVSELLDNLSSSYFLLEKLDRDGSEQVLQQFDTRKNYVLCGVNITQCVAQTTIGLLSSGRSVEIVKACCGDSSEADNLEAFNIFQNIIPAALQKSLKLVDNEFANRDEYVFHSTVRTAG